MSAIDPNTAERVTIPGFARRQGYTITPQLENLAETVANDAPFQQFLVEEVNRCATDFFDRLEKALPDEEWRQRDFRYRFDFYQDALGEKFAEIILQTWEHHDHDEIDRDMFERFSALTVTNYLGQIFQKALQDHEKERIIEGVDIYPVNSLSYYLSEPKVWRNITRVVMAPLGLIYSVFGSRPYSVYFQVKLEVYRNSKT